MRIKLRVLIIGNGNSIWILNYIKHVLIPNNILVFLCTPRNINKEYLEFYNSNNVLLLYNCIDNSFIQKIPKVRGILNILYNLYQIYKYKPYNAIHVHFADISSCRIAYLCHKLTRKEICSFWGSDLFRSSDRQIKTEGIFR